MKRLIAVTLITALAATGCASLQERRAKWDTPGREAEAVSDQQFLADDAICDNEAKNNSNGYLISGVVLNSIGILVWPVLVPGLIVTSVGIAKSVIAKNRCMAERGYTPKGEAVSQAPSTAERGLITDEASDTRRPQIPDRLVQPSVQAPSHVTPAQRPPASDPVRDAQLLRCQQSPHLCR